ncbi:Spo0E like sporulation regulatory protein [Geosporobacter subterraneus DSM 17957]|uniref:Spo0E like sporulation regulatory protein n=1 Tax=Geosporobacter subterraneus DSM 17957 TaxID=1121919 RepID=A0A1M6PEW9_9FIRM|nr:Spo0E like sporulation regulatory protein [Geosporobacter subterraneus DSM 17957]
MSLIHLNNRFKVVKEHSGGFLSPNPIFILQEKEKKKEQKGQNNEVNNLAKEIREIRDELNRKIDGKSKIFTSTEILELSQKLDKLIVNYLGKK